MPTICPCAHLRASVCVCVCVLFSWSNEISVVRRGIKGRLRNTNSFSRIHCNKFKVLHTHTHTNIWTCGKCSANKHFPTHIHKGNRFSVAFVTKKRTHRARKSGWRKEKPTEGGQKMALCGRSSKKQSLGCQMWKENHVAALQQQPSATKNA